MINLALVHMNMPEWRKDWKMKDQSELQDN